MQPSYFLFLFAIAAIYGTAYETSMAKYYIGAAKIYNFFAKPDDGGIENILYAFKLALGEEKWRCLLQCTSCLFLSFILSFIRNETLDDGMKYEKLNTMLVLMVLILCAAEYFQFIFNDLYREKEIVCNIILALNLFFLALSFTQFIVRSIIQILRGRN